MKTKDNKDQATKTLIRLLQKPYLQNNSHLKRLIATLRGRK